MEVVAPLLGAQSVAETTVTSSNDVQELGRDVFLRLLVTQLQSQDPTNPTQNEDFIAQLAQFTTLEQTNNTNNLLEDLLSQNQQRSQLDLVSLIGHEVVTDGNTVSLGESGETSLVYVLGDDAVSVNVEVFDANGTLVRALNNLGAQVAGQHEIVWDGNDTDGNRVEAGTYQFRVSAVDSQQGEVASTTFMRDVVKSVIWGNEQPTLTLGSGKTLLSPEILSVQ